MIRRSARTWAWLVAILVGPVMAGCSTNHSSPPAASEPVVQQSTFASPEAATDALVAALRADDQGALHQVFGPGGDEIISSGDEVADRAARSRFLSSYDEKHSLVKQDDGRVALQIGAHDWPFPIPIVPQGQAWRFDTDSGKDEILNRRIGRNEMSTIQTCMAIADAQWEYASMNMGGDGVPEYAQKFFSDPGKKNGLYWETEAGAAPSPLGPLVAVAADEGYTPTRVTNGQRAPFHGYHYRMLKAEGPSAPCGAFDYMVKGRMIGGFGAVAYPDEYGNSGVMTFIINFQGVVYQKDLGPDTAKIAAAMTTYDPGSGWEKVAPPEPTTQD